MYILYRRSKIQGCRRVLVRHMPHKFHRDATARTEVSRETLRAGAVEVYPAIFKPEPRAQRVVTDADKLLEALDKKPKSKAGKKSKRAGIRVYVAKQTRIKAVVPDGDEERIIVGSAGPAEGRPRPRTEDDVVDDDDPAEPSSSGESEEEEGGEEELRYLRKNGEIRVRRADGSYPVERDGRITGPFGSGLSWTMTCRKHTSCRLVKSSRQLKSDETHLIAWLIRGLNPGVKTAKAHKEYWTEIAATRGL